MKRVSVFLAVAAIAACSQNADGSYSSGMKGSVYWFRTAPTQEKVEYLTPVCSAYGFEVGTVDFSKCIQDEIASRSIKSPR